MKNLVTLFTLLLTGNIFGKVPDEMESLGGNGLALGDAAMAALSEQSSVRANPAMLAFERQYTVSGAYHWPRSGREFYQAGAVDSQTSDIAAGVTYASAFDKYKDVYPVHDFSAQRYSDSPIEHRVSLGLAKALGQISLGLGFTFVKGYDLKEYEPKIMQGSAMGFGLAGLFTQFLRYGVSIENFSNKKIAELAPRFFRAGLAYTMFGGDVTAHLDYRARQRLLQEASSFELSPINLDEPTLSLEGAKKKDEQLWVASFSFRVQNILRVLAAYTHEPQGDKRQALSGGLSLVHEGFALSYQMSQPYLSENLYHQAVNLSVRVAL